MSDLANSRRELTRKLFFHSADDDYICARLAATHSLYRHFAWNAGQALEKYTKCICILTGGNALFGHSFVNRLLDDVIAPNQSMFPTEIDITSFTKVRKTYERFSSEPLKELLYRLEEMGRPNGRYRTTNSSISPYDLQKLDRIVFLLRRLCVDAPKGTEESQAYIEKLENDHYYSNATEWPTVAQNDDGSLRKREALQFENCANFPDTFQNSKGWFFSAWDASPHDIGMLAGYLNEEDKNWLKERVKL